MTMSEEEADKTFSPTVKLSADDYKEFEKHTGLTLDESHRKALRQALLDYEYREHLRVLKIGANLVPNVSRLGSVLKEATAIINSLPKNPGHIWPFLATDARIGDYNEEVARLERLTKSCETFAKTNRRVGRRRDVNLNRLLTDLENIFKDSGGQSARITRAAIKRPSRAALSARSQSKRVRSTGERTGRFLDFLYAAMQHLPQKPQSQDSLGARWERIIAKRKKGRQELPWVGESHPAKARIYFRNRATVN